MSRVVVIHGDTPEAWAAALYVKRNLGALTGSVMIVPGTGEGSASPGALVAPPRTRAFFETLGLPEETLFKRAGASFLLGARMTGPRDFFLAYGNYGAPANAIPFHHYWKRLNDEGRAAPFDHYALGAELARQGRFVHPAPDPKKIESSFSYGYTLDGPAFLALLREEAVGCGVEEVSREVAEASQPWLILDAGGETSGANWAAWPDLPAVFDIDERTGGAPPGNLSIYEVEPGREALSVRLHPRERTITRRVSFHADGGLVTGRRTAPWSGNRIALGPSACRLPGLHMPQLMLLQAELDLLSGLLPSEDAAMSAVAAEYNRRATRTMDYVADYEALSLGLFGPDRRTEFESPSLARKVEQFASRGRLVTYDDELYGEQEWIAAFIGGGLLPERFSPLALGAPLEAVGRNYEGLRQAIGQAAGRLPTQQVYLEHLMKKTEGAPNAV